MPTVKPFIVKVCFCLLFLLPWVPVAGWSEPLGLAARVNGQEITAKRFEHYFEDFLSDRGRNIASIRNPTVLKKLRGEALDALVDEELLTQEAARKGIAASTAEVDAAVAAMRANFKSQDAFARRLERAGFDEAGYRAYVGQQLAVKRLVESDIQPKVSVSDRDVHRFYVANPSRFAIPAQVRIRQIFIASGNDPAGALSRCQEILAQARRPRSDFAALARQYSQDQSAPVGGDLGFLAEDQLPPFLQPAVSSLKPGQVTGPVQSDAGCHVLKLEQRRSGTLPEAEARESARSYLKAEKTQAAVRQRIQSLRSHARIEILMPR